MIRMVSIVVGLMDLNSYTEVDHGEQQSLQCKAQYKSTRILTVYLKQGLDEIQNIQGVEKTGGMRGCFDVPEADVEVSVISVSYIPVGVENPNITHICCNFSNFLKDYPLEEP